ncbi:hypothetical protein ACFSUS_28105 [Spirosoma soli]|uniref:Uncharacterized protein n=1 Tax=Spirosoma soli TaxID=1770529 RepID=A0ABW5MDG4_9BACT
MRRLLSYLCSLAILTSCGTRSTETTTAAAGSADSVATTTAPETTCFQQVVGRDTTTLRLTISDSIVTGELSVLPFEKDRATGPVRGTLANGQVKADWQRSGEGVTQPYEVAFTMKGDTVMWREGERIEKQGKWVLANPDKGYQYVLTRVECIPTGSRD